MARKNLLSGLLDDSKKFTAVNSEPAEADDRPHLGHRIGALGAVTRSIDALAAKADAAKAIEEKLAAGETVVDLDTGLIDDSFVSDRLSVADDAFQELVEAIRVRGQDSPILVRPHPDKPGRYQIAFGHRRARAARELGRPVRAVVKHLDDRDHVIAQGQENSARSDLAFIERTMFAHKLEVFGFSRDIIMAALNADKTTVSKMLSVTKRIPTDVLELIILALSVGRDRWHELSAAFDDPAVEDRALGLIEEPQFEAADPERRFEMLELIARPKREGVETARPKARRWRSEGDAVKAVIKDDGKKFTIALQSDKASAFGAYLADNLDRLFEAFEREQTSNGD
jgi:ParB family chromosome partitioning protein